MSQRVDPIEEFNIQARVILDRWERRKRRARGQPKFNPPTEVYYSPKKKR